MRTFEASKTTAPVELTDREADQVAGGLFYLSAGCSTCRSGLDLNALASLQNIINPAVQPNIQIGAVPTLAF